MRKFFLEPKIIVAHNSIRFDKRVVERILGIKIENKIVDSLALSWCLFPTRIKHGLEEWGEFFGIKKPEIIDWDNLSIEEYTHRCEEDVKINFMLWEYLLRMLNHLYDKSQDDIWRYIDYISSKMDQAALQEESRWKLDREFAEKHFISMSNERTEKTDVLQTVMPKVPIKKIRKKPKVFFKKDGNLSSAASQWIDFCKENKIYGSPEEVEYVSGYEEPNPGSPDQVKAWLTSLGWVPETHKQVKDKKTGEIREVPQINREKQKGGGVCHSIKKLYDKEPNLELLDGLSVLSHRIGILNGFLRDADSGGYLKARISGFTNTLRVKHTEIVNLPKVNIAYGEALRGSLIAPDGYELCGSDMTSLEDRLKQHYIFPLDPDYVNEMSKPGYDPHLDIAKLAGRLIEEDIEHYKYVNSLEDDVKKTVDLKRSKEIKFIRDIMKNVNYAGQYGAGPPRISITGGISLSEARELHKVYWERNWAIKEVAKQQIVKQVNGLMWLFNPVSRFWYYLKYDKDRFSTLVQGTASYCFDTWLKYILQERRQLTATFHDEGVWTVKKGNREACTDLMKRAIQKTNEELCLNRVLDVDIQYGSRYSEIH